MRLIKRPRMFYYIMFLVFPLMLKSNIQYISVCIWGNLINYNVCFLDRTPMGDQVYAPIQKWKRELTFLKAALCNFFLPQIWTLIIIPTVTFNLMLSWGLTYTPLWELLGMLPSWKNRNWARTFTCFNANLLQLGDVNCEASFQLVYTGFVILRSGL